MKKAKRKKKTSDVKKKDEMRDRKKAVRIFASILLSIIILLFAVSVALFVAGCHSSGQVVPSAETPKDDYSMFLTKGAELTVDYNLTPEEMITAGHYDWYDPQILEKFMSYQEGDGVQKVRFAILQPLHDISTDEIKSYLQTCGLRMANLAELLAFGAQYPAVQRSWEITTAGDDNIFWIGGKLFQGITPDLQVSSNRFLGFFTKPFSNSQIVWDKDFTFLAIYLNPADAPPSGGG